MKTADTQTDGYIQVLGLILWLTRCLKTCIIYDFYLRPIILLGLLYTCTTYFWLCAVFWMWVATESLSCRGWVWRCDGIDDCWSGLLLTHCHSAYTEDSLELQKTKNKAVYLWHSNLYQSASGSTQSAPWKPK